MSWKMYIDDERFPKAEGFIIVRSVAEAQSIILTQGCPSFISFDHDLGDQVPTGHDLVKWLVDEDLKQEGKFLPDNFTFNVHSANPVGRDNIISLFTSYLKFKGEKNG